VVLTDGYVFLDLIDHILTINKQLSSLADKRAKAIRGDQDWKIQDACLLYKGRLVVLKDDNLRTKLLWFIYAALDTAHLGKTKTFQLIAPRYYWKGLRADVERYVANCYECRRALVP
jgi:hypothetical protein